MKYLTKCYQYIVNFRWNDFQAQYKLPKLIQEKVDYLNTLTTTQNTRKIFDRHTILKSKNKKEY